MIDKDTLLKKLEALRSEPVQEFVRKESEWNDYTEYVDAEKICKKPVVSCCVFTYNQEKYIRECLDSIVSQKADFDYEVLVCEDCSTDGTLAICREFQTRYPEKVRIIHANRNYYRGALNFRRGYELARGEYIAICEGDDYWCNDAKIQLQYNAAREKNAVAVFTDHKRLLGGRLEKDGCFKSQNLYTRINSFTKDDYIAERFDINRFDGRFFATATILVKKEVLVKIKNSDFGRRMFGLGDLQIRSGAPRYGNIVFLPMVTAVYRLGVGVSTVPPKAQSIDFVVDCALVNVSLKWDVMTDCMRALMMQCYVTGLLLRTHATKSVKKQVRKLSLSLLRNLPLTFLPRFVVLYILNYFPDGYVVWRWLYQIRKSIRNA